MDTRDREMPVPIEGEELEINVLELLQILAKRKMLIIKSCLATAVVTAGISLCLSNIYMATAKVLPPQKEGGGGIAALLGQAGGLASLAGGSLGLGGSSDLYVGILKSRSVADAVIKRLDLEKIFKAKDQESARKALVAAVKIVAGKDGIISIDASDKDPQLAAKIANAMVDELNRKSVQLNLTKAGTERIFLEKRLELVKIDLKKAEEELKSFAEKNKAIKVETQATASIESIARLRAEIVSKEVQLDALRSYQTEENQDVRALQAALARLRSQHSAMAGAGRSNDAMLTVGSVPSLGLEYARRMRDLKIQEAIFEQLTKQYEVAKLSEAKDSSSLQILDEAVVPIKKDKPKRSIIVLIATFMAFIVSVVIAFVQEYASTMSAEDMERWQAIRSSLSFKRQ